MPDCFEFRAKHFEQELLGFRQPNLIQCLSEGQVDRKIYCSLTLGLRAREPIRLTVVCETKWSETKWNETKWKSVVCEMKICSLRNENL